MNNPGISSHPNFAAIFLISGLFVCVATPSRGSLAVDFSAKADASCKGRGYDGKADKVPFSLTDPRSPVTDGYGGTSATFYGGAAADPGRINLFGFEAEDASLRVRLQVSHPGDTARAVFLWRKEDFLNGLDREPAILAERSSFSVNARRFGASVAGSVRFVIGKGEELFISDVVGSIPASFSRVSLNDPLAAKWYQYEPAREIGAIGEPATPVFENLTVLGVFFEISSTSAGQNVAIAFNDFEVEVK